MYIYVYGYFVLAFITVDVMSYDFINLINVDVDTHIVKWLLIDSYSICLVCVYSQLRPCVHLAKTDILIIRTAAKSQAKVNHRCLTEINSRYYGLLLMRTLTQGLYSAHYKGS